jgi:hypothetical protein
MSKKLIICLLGAVVCGPAAFAITYTGDVPTDFSSLGALQVQNVTDSIDDVGLPANATPGVVSGWDVSNSVFAFDGDNDQLHVGLDFRGFAGDADGDGADGISSLWLMTNGGIDLPALALTESICIAFDFDQDGTFDVIAGDNALNSTYHVSTFVGSPLLPAFGFGPALPGNEGAHFYGPDYELTLDNVSRAWDTTPETFCFNFLVFAGSYQDDGIGEDLLSGEICFHNDHVEAMTPATYNMVQAYPNPFNPTTTLAVDLAETGNVQLAVYNINGQLVRTLVDGMMESGKHQVAFDGAGLPSGLYLARLSTVQGDQVTRLMLTK